MLKPKYLEKLPDAMIELYSQVEQDILSDMARRIATYDYWIPAANWQYQKLIAMGNFHSYVLKALSARTGRTTVELEKLMAEAGAESLAFDKAIYQAHGLDPPPLAASEALQGILREGLKKTEGLFQNLTSTTASTATQQFERALDRAWLQISSGAFDANAAIRMAVKELSRQGVGAITYPTGHVDSIEVAVRRAVVTGVNQTALRLQDALADEMGCDLVETTAHAGARPDHAVWQGQVFSRSGKSKEYPDFVASTGYGTGPGLGGWNCRHSFFPYFEGSPRAYSKELLQQFEAKAYTYNGQKLTEYEASQVQRYHERQIRRWKRENLAMQAAGQDTGESAAKIKRWQDTQKDFLSQTGLKRQGDREQVAGWGKKQAGAVRHDLAKYEKYRYNKDGTIVVTDDWKEKEHPRIPASYKPFAVIDTLSRNGKQRDRTIYDGDGRMSLQIHGGNHGQPKQHAYGEFGEHVHTYEWVIGKNQPTRCVREVTSEERFIHKDIVGGDNNERR